MIGLLFLMITVATFLSMEVVTWLTHKFVMHGSCGIFMKTTINQNMQTLLKETMSSLSFLRYQVYCSSILVSRRNKLFIFYWSWGFYAMAFLFLIHDVLFHHDSNGLSILK